MGVVGTEELDVTSNLDITVNGPEDITAIDPTDTEVQVVKRAYTVVGDNVYVPSGSYDDVPDWVKNLVQNVVNFEIDTRDTNLLANVDSILSLFEIGYVPKNQYDSYVIQQQTAYDSLTTRVDSLDATVQTNETDVNAKIQNIENTYATTDSAAALVTAGIQSSINDTTSGTSIGSKIASVQQTITDLDSTYSNNYEVLTSSLADADSKLDANATAVSGLQTYVGVDPNGGLTGTGLLADVEILQKQNDGVIETVADTYDVVLNAQDGNPGTTQLVTTAEPYATWKAADDLAGNENVRLAHIGDVYIKYATTSAGAKEYIASYKFIKTTVDSTSPYATDTEGYTWSLIVDQAAQAAFEAALNAHDLADDKRRVFVGLGATETPSAPYDQGDLWLIDAERTVNGYECKVGDILRCVETKGNTATYEQNDWVVASSYATAVNAQQQAFQDWVDGDYSDELDLIRTQVDKKAESFYQENMPHSEGANTEYAVWVGDLWKKPSTNDEYVYELVNGIYKWVKTDVPDIVYDTIDGKKTIFTGNDVPTAIGVNDMWITGNNPVSPYEAESIYVWIKVSSNPDTFEWKMPVKYTDNQYAIDIENGTKQVDISSYDLNSSGWGSLLTEFNYETQLSEELNRITTLEETNDGVVNSFYQTTAPTVEISYGDWWVDTDSVPAKAYRYEDVNGKNIGALSWVDNSTHILGKAYIGAIGAQSTADGKIKTFYQSGVPTSEGVGDLWIDINDNNKTYRAAIKGANEIKAGEWVRVTDESALDNFLVSTYSKDLLNIGNQIDGKADTYFQGTEPYSFASLTTEEKSAKDGDVWYDTTPTSGVEAYRFDETSGWVKIEDTQTLQALSDASAAQATADGKIQNFTSEPTAPYYIGDTWMQGGSGDIYVCQTENLSAAFDSAHWVIASKYTDDSAVTLLQTGLSNGTVAIDLSSSTVNGTDSIVSYVGAQIDQEVVVYSGNDYTTQTGMKTDDIFIESKEVADSNNNIYTETTIYIYNGASWVSQTNADSSIAGLSDLADGKRTIYSNQSHDVPTGEVNDIWIPTTGADDLAYIPKEVYQHNETSWVLATKYTEDLDNFASEVNHKITTLRNQVDGKIEYLYYDNPTNSPLTTISSGWGEAENGNVVYYKDIDEGYWYNSTLDSFEQLTDTSILKALKSAEDAQATADGVVVSYYAIKQDTAPATTKFWLNKTGTKVLKEYNGTSWVDVAVKEGDTLTAFDPVSADSSIYIYYSGAWVTETENGLVASSQAVTDLALDLSNLDSSIYGASGLQQTLEGEITAEGARVESNFVYNSNIAINGETYSSGFGLTSEFIRNNDGTGSKESEFWINADKFKFTNNNNTGAKAPFTIDATGTQPEITFNGTVNFSNVVGGDEAITNTVQAWLPTQGAVAAYGSATASNVTATQEGWIDLHSSTDSSIGLAFPAISVANVASNGGTVEFKLAIKGSAAYSTGVYIRVYEYDSTLPAGKTHVSGNAPRSDSVVQEATRGKTIFYENGAISTSWSTKTYSYTPTSTAKMASVVVLNWTGMRTAHLYIKDFQINAYPDPDVSSQLPQTITSVAIPTLSDIYPVNSLWRRGPLTIEGQTDQYQHWLSLGGGNWQYIGGTYINGSEIITGSIDAARLDVNSIFAQDITYTGTITGGNTVGGGIIQSYDGSMRIDLVNGSIYIS